MRTKRTRVATAVVALLLGGLLAVFATSGPAVAFFLGRIVPRRPSRVPRQAAGPRSRSRGAAGGHLQRRRYPWTCRSPSWCRCSEQRPSRRAPPSRLLKSSAVITSPAAARRMPRSSKFSANVANAHPYGCRRGRDLAAVALLIDVPRRASEGTPRLRPPHPGSPRNLGS